MSLERTAAENTVSQYPIIGILTWEGRPGQLLSQLEAIPGNILNNRTFSFPVCYQRVPGANFHTVIERPSEKLLQSTIECARILESKGVQAITTIHRHHYGRRSLSNARASRKLWNSSYDSTAHCRHREDK